MSTDSKAESERIMSHLGENVIALEGQTDATMIATALDALRLATIYAGDQTAELVKEQRTANLIAMTRADMSAGYGIPAERLDEIAERLS